MKSSSTEDQTADLDGRFVRTIIGSTPFKWACGVLGAGAVAIFVIGWKSMAATAASDNFDVINTKADVEVLKTSVRSIQELAQEHSIALSQAAIDRQTNATVQSKIFDAIHQLSDQIHTVDIHVATVDQKVQDIRERSN